MDCVLNFILPLEDKSWSGDWKEVRGSMGLTSLDKFSVLSSADLD